MLSSVSRSMRWAFLLMDMTDSRTSMEPWSFPLVIWDGENKEGKGDELRPPGHHPLEVMLGSKVRQQVHPQAQVTASAGHVSRPPEHGTACYVTSQPELQGVQSEEYFPPSGVCRQG